MANFTDKTPPTFNPYIQQLPVEAMVNVGTARQGQYDQGVQRIQQQIDNIGGMDIVRDIDKQYLQSKLDSLGQNLKLVAAGDFSNFQLVNSVGGMSSQIAKDPNVLNAVASTRNYRRGVKDMRAADKAGKGSPSNSWDFQTQAADWLDSDNLEDSFDGQYNPYTDFRQHSIDIFKELSGDETITDASFTKDENGNIVPTDATTRRKMAGVSPERIQQALMVGLSPADWKQMEIDGRHSYSNMDGETFANSVTSQYKRNYDAAAGKKASKEAALKLTKDVSTRAELNYEISQIDKQMKGIQKEYQGIANSFKSGDAESAKGQLYVTDFINGLSSAFSYTESSVTQVTNPNATMAMQREVKEQAWKIHAMNYNQRDKHFYDKMAQERYLSQMEFENKYNQPLGALPMGINRNDLPEDIVGKVRNNIRYSEKKIADDDGAFMKKVNVDEEQFDKQYKLWSESANNVTDVYADYFKDSEGLRRQTKATFKMMNDIDEAVKNEIGTIYDYIPEDSPNYISPNGVTYTPQELVDFNETFEKYVTPAEKIFSPIMGGGSTTIPAEYNDELAYEELSEKELTLYEVLKEESKGELPDEFRDLPRYMRKLKRQVNIPYTGMIVDIRKETDKRVADRITISQGAGHSVDITKPAQIDQFRSLLTTLANRTEEQKGGLAHSPEFDVNAVRKMAPELSSANVKIVEGTEYSDPIYRFNINDTNGNSIDFELTPEEKQAVFGSMFELSPEMQMFRPYQTQMAKVSDNETTSFDGTLETNVGNAFLKTGVDFINEGLQGYNLTGNIIQSGGRYKLQLNIYDPEDGKVHENIEYPRKDWILPENMAAQLAGLDDEAIYQLRHDNKPTEQDLKKLRNSSKRLENGR